MPREKNAEFVACMEDVLEVYHRPLDGCGRGIRLAPGRWHELRFEWVGLSRRARHGCRLYVNGPRQRRRLPLNRASRNGISYVQFISTAGAPDESGFLIKSVAAEAK